MNYLQLAQRTRQECGVSGTGPTTTLSQSGENKRLCDWVAQAWVELQQEYPNWAWNWLRGSFVFNTVASADTYDVTAVGIVARFAQWVPDTFTIYKQSSGVATETVLEYMPYNDWRRVYELGTPVSGFPQHVTVKPDLSLAVGPVPDDVYVIGGDYIKTPQEFALDADIPEMPSQFHMAIVYKAMMYYARYEAAAEIYTDAELAYNKLVRRIAINQLPELSLSGALA